MLTPTKSRKIAIALAFAGTVSPLPLSWLHKLYVGDYLWSIFYLVLSPTGIPQVACGLEGLWYLTQSDERFGDRFPSAGTLLGKATAHLPISAIGAIPVPEDSTAASQTSAMAAALRELDQLRQDGLITEYEFEQKRRKLLGKIS